MTAALPPALTTQLDFEISGTPAHAPYFDPGGLRALARMRIITRQSETYLLVRRLLGLRVCDCVVHCYTLRPCRHLSQKVHETVAAPQLRSSSLIDRIGGQSQLSNLCVERVWVREEWYALSLASDHAALLYVSWRADASENGCKGVRRDIAVVACLGSWGYDVPE